MGNENEGVGTVGWVLIGTGIGVGLYLLLRPKPGGPAPTLVTPVPSAEAPLGFANLGAVQSRFDDLRDIYHMGKLTPHEAIVQVDALQRAAISLSDRGVGDPQAARDLVGRLEEFKAQIQDFVSFKQSQEVQP